MSESNSGPERFADRIVESRAVSWQPPPAADPVRAALQRNQAAVLAVSSSNDGLWQALQGALSPVLGQDLWQRVAASLPSDTDGLGRLAYGTGRP